MAVPEVKAMPWLPTSMAKPVSNDAPEVILTNEEDEEELHQLKVGQT